MECLNNLINHPISIHAPREGCDRKAFKSISKAKHFNPRTPRGVRQGPSGRCSRDSDNFNPRTPRGVRPRPPPSLCHSQSISIHAPREGCDQTGGRRSYPESNFNPRTPRGVRHTARRELLSCLQFQSTHPARGATLVGCLSMQDFWNFNPRTPRGVRQQTLPKSREFAWLNLLICTRGRRLSIQKQTRLCSIKLSFMLFGCEPAGEGVSSWTSHATKSKVRLEGRSA